MAGHDCMSCTRRASARGSTRSRARCWRRASLARLMKEDAIVGVTSNPTIFQKALATGEWYDEQLGELLKTEDDPTEIFLQLAMEDIRA